MVKMVFSWRGHQYDGRGELCAAIAAPHRQAVTAPPAPGHRRQSAPALLLGASFARDEQNGADQREERKMHIAWYGPAAQSARQGELLQVHFPQLVINYRGQAGNAARTVVDFRRSSADDLVMIAPRAVLEHVLREGVRPIWADAELCLPDHPERDIGPLPDGRCFRSTGYRRLVEMSFQTEVPTPLPIKGRVARVLALMSHIMSREEEDAIRALYPNATIIKDPRPFKGVPEIRERFAQANADDLLSVAPLSIFGELCGQGLQPLRGVMQVNRFLRLERVLALKEKFEPL